MSDYTEGSRKRDRHRRHRNRDAQGRDGRESQARDGRGSDAHGRDSRPRGAGSGAKEATPVREPAKDARRERREELPPLPKLPTPACSRCGQPIQDITSSLADKGTGAPVHFDCVISFLEGAENVAPNDKIVYIGQGRFAIMHFENPSDTRKFKIVKVIEWEGRDARPEWRAEISGRFSQTK